MKYETPASFDGLETKAIDDLLKAALDEYADLGKIADADLSDEQLDRLEYLAAGIESIKGEVATRDTAAAERAQRAADARAKLDAASETPADEEPVVDETPVDVVIPDDASSITEPELVTAAGGVASRAAKRTAAAVVAPVVPALPSATLIASADIPGITTGAEVAGLAGAADAFIKRFKGLPKTKANAQVTNRYGVIEIHKGIDPAFQLKQGDNDGNMGKILAATRQERLPGGSLVAAGGWCAPSTTVYDLCSLETVSGILDLPEVTITHGGISFTKGPDFSDIYADAGFLQTEAQAEAGTVKPFADVECPDFTEVRLDAIGYGLRAGILTNAAWPELVRRYIEGTITAHAHKVNASKINRVVALLGAAINAGEIGSFAADTLNALELQVNRLRYKFRLDPEALIEGFAPVWMRSVFRADLAYRTGVENMLSVTNAQVDAWFAARGIRLQYVYDWQDLTATGVAFPTTVKVALYPAGSYVAGTSDVISLDAVYDTASLSVNTYTAMFAEEGLLVFNPCGNGVQVEIAVTAGVYGRTGAADITSLVTP